MSQVLLSGTPKVWARLIVTIDQHTQQQQQQLTFHSSAKWGVGWFCKKHLLCKNHLIVMLNNLPSTPIQKEELNGFAKTSIM
jgi:hypothetical protein